MFFNFLSMLPIILLADVSRAEADIPKDDQILNQVGHSIQAELPSQFKMLVWNIHKAGDGPSWQKDFHQLARQSDVVLLQEGYQVPTYQEVIGQLPDMLWNFATSFIYKGHATGVATGSGTRPLNTQWLRSPGREPVVQSPKMTILTEFDLAETQETLLIANIHGINFVTNGTFYDHINQVITTIEKHQGPLIFAGDFNTWNQSRMEYLLERCEKLGLTKITFESEPRNNPLDHVFYRGLIPTQAEVLASISSSDHLPLKVEFSLHRSSRTSTWSLNKKY